jgi:glycosyltransferase involved in cell wall biosynthesis
VALDARVLDAPGLRAGGIGRYAACLEEALRRGGAAVELVSLRELWRPPTPARVREGWEHLLLGRDALRAGAELLHSPSVDLATLRPRMPYVITLHDLVPLKHRDHYLRTGLKHRLRYRAVRGATRVIVPSRVVAADAEQLLGLDRARVDVVHEAAAPSFAPVHDAQERLERLKLPDRFLLWVGKLDPPDARKGLPALATAVTKGDGPPLVLAGHADEHARSLATPRRVLLCGRVSDAELAALYTAADTLVFPSQDEGFGLPPVEALACGTPVAAFAAGALPEVLGESPHVELVELGDTRGLLEAAERLAGTEATPLPRTWRDVAHETEGVYLRAQGGGSRP